MCGIFGLWHTDQRPVDLHAVQRATQALRHRGPDDEGYLLIDTQRGRTVACRGRDSRTELDLPPIEHFHDEHFDLAFGFRRLAILDLSPAGHQPMVSADGRYWLIYNGEIYNYLELRAELTTRGHQFHTNTDTEVILAAYSQWGADCLQRFNGMWAFAIWDSQEQSLFLTRDRFGIKPLYYTTQNQQLAFASEIKALIAGGSVPFTPNDRAVYEYLMWGALPDPQQGDTFFRGVHALPPAAHLHTRNQSSAMQKYWGLDISTPTGRVSDEAAVIDEYHSIFTDAVRLRLRSDVTVGTCLSGGLDSSSIVCTMDRLLASGEAPANAIHGGQQSFSAVYEADEPYNERQHIEKVLAATHVQGHFVVPTVEQLQADLRQLVWHQDEPFVSTSIFAQWCVMRLARANNVTVLLDGQGADESLAGYRPFAIFLADLMRQAHFGRFFAEMRAIPVISGTATRSLLLQALLYQLPGDQLPGLRHKIARMRADTRMLHPQFVAEWQDVHIVERHPWQTNRNLNSHLHHRLLTTLPELLRYEDRNSMAHSIEARVPFLDYRLVQFTFNQAADLRIHNGWTKWVLRKAMQETGPAEIIWRKDKVGFATPHVQWIRHLRDCFFESMHDSPLSHQYINVDVVQGMWNTIAKMSDSQKQGLLLWRILNLQIWLSVFQENQIAPMSIHRSELA